ncbi:hypothetical protein [Anaerococcus urinomassiliensis]|nr:hypothetical protein [Anaerococcus urinomassiliensis]
MRSLGISMYPDKSDNGELKKYLKSVYKKAGEYSFFNHIYGEVINLYDET